MKKPIIFLDFDGVVNTIYYRYYPRQKREMFHYANASDGFVNNRQAIEWLNNLYFHCKYPFCQFMLECWPLPPSP